MINLPHMRDQIIRNRKIDRLHRQIEWYIQLRKKQTTVSGWGEFNKRIQQLRQEIKMIGAG